MFLRAKTRRKDGKEHRYWSIAENRCSHGGRVVQRQVLYLGEINDSQQGERCRVLEVLDDGGTKPRQMAIFPDDRAPVTGPSRLRCREMTLPDARDWDGSWVHIPELG